MKFIDEIEPKVSLNTFSQSFGKLLETCKLRAWFTVRDRRKAYPEDNRAMQVGICTHELFAKKVAAFIGETHEENRSADYSASVKYESKILMKRSFLDNIVSDPEDVYGFEKRASYTLSNGIQLVGVFDLLVLRQNEKGPYMEVYDLKTSHKLSKEDHDLQSLIYAFLAAVIYGMPVLFVKQSCRSGERKEEYYSYDDAMGIEELLEEASSRAKSIVESNEKPRASACAKCVECPFLDECTAQNNVSLELDDLMNEFQWLSAKTKSVEAELKELREASGTDLESNGHKVIRKETKRKTLKAGSKKLSKKDVLSLIIADGNIGSYLEDLDVAYSDRILEKMKDMGVDIDVSISKQIKIES